MSRYLALVNVPGYMPWDDEPPIFETPAEAWEYLAEHRERAYGIDGLPEEDGIHRLLLLMAEDRADEREQVGLALDGTGDVYGDTPGYDGEHDLGLVYSVVQAEQRLATAEEQEAYLAGREEFPGAEETEHGLLLPV